MQDPNTSLRGIGTKRPIACYEAAYRAKAATTRPNRPALEAPSLTLAAALVDLTMPVLVLVPETEPKVLEASLLEAIDGISKE